MKKMMSAFLASTLTAASLIAIPQTIVFDFGGVMTGESNREGVITFIQDSFQISLETYHQLNQKKKEALKQGMTDEEFWITHAKNEGIILSPQWSHSFRGVLKEALAINPKMYLLIEELREKQIPVAMLSNIDSRLAQFVRDFGLYEPFNPCLLSYEIGIEKPDPKIYEFLLNTLNLPPQDVVFVDDLIENVEAAKKMGIDAILFESEPQLRSELVKRGVLNEYHSF